MLRRVASCKARQTVRTFFRGLIVAFRIHDNFSLHSN